MSAEGTISPDQLRDDAALDLSNNTVLSKKVFRAIGINTTLDDTYDVVSVTAGGVVVTLPTATSVSGRIFRIDNDSSSDITVNTALSQTIEGETSQSIPTDSCMVVISNNSNWRII